MSMKVNPRFLKDAGPEIFTGNELLLKGALETEGGVHLLGGYPGSPISGFFDSMTYIKDLLSEKGIRAVINNNEALAVAMLNGSQVAGCRGMIAMKSVGVHVAADALALGNLAGAHPNGGAIVVIGDDPWSDSTQVPADSRYLSKHLHMPIIEPSTFQEIKDYVNLSFKLSAESELYVGYIITNNQADGGGTVECRANQFPTFNTNQPINFDTESIDLNKFVLLPPKTWWQEANLSERFARAVSAARRMGINRIDYPSETRAKIGFISAGLGYGYLIQSLDELGLLGKCPVLKFGMSYPIDEEMVCQLAEQCERIIVVEERRGFLEEQVSRAVSTARQRGKLTEKVEVWGKKFPGGIESIPSIRGLQPSIITERLGRLFKSLQDSGIKIGEPQMVEAWDSELANIEQTGKKSIPDLPVRLATFCPGCPHRDSANLCLEIKRSFMDSKYMKKHHSRGPIDMVFHGDIGCYTMLMYPPNTPLMHNLSGMGLGGGTGSGMDPFITNKQVVFMGDSTFFHCGLLAISQAIKLGQDITFIILDNSTTGMTGHQPTPGVEYDILGNETPKQDIEDVVNGIGGGLEDFMVIRTDPEQRRQYKQLLEQTFLADGVKVIIADKECAITRGRRKRREEREIIKQRGYLPSKEYMNINHEVCRFCLTCAELAGCPGLTHVQTEYGPKMSTDLTRCVDDGACERIGACSSFERLTVKRNKPPRSHVPELGLDDIPEPEKRTVDDLWRCCLVGVGGMGIGVATSIVLRAGHKEGYDVVFVDKKGLAIRNGGVVSQVVYNVTKKNVTALIPFGKADLLIGVDALEAARAIDPRGRTRIATPDKTVAVVNTAKVQTTSGVMGREDYDPEQMEQVVRKYTRGDDFMARDVARISEKYLGSKLYTNIMMLGFAFQKGLIPVSMHSMAWAIRDTIQTDVRKNLYAFNIGRKLVVQEDLFRGPAQKTSWRDLLEERCRHTIRRHGGKHHVAEELRTLTAGLVTETCNLDEKLKLAIVVRIYDCMRWGGIEYARKYAMRIASVYEEDHAEFDYAATKAAIYNLADAMLVKDLVFISELATSPEKYTRDREKYNVNPANGDRISYRHMFHIPISLGPWTFKTDFVTYDWTLKVLKRMRWLRKLPGWNRDERKYLQRYEKLVDDFAYDDAEEYNLQLAKLSSAKCIDCDQPRCSEIACPLENSIPVWIALAHNGKWKQAAEKLHQTNNFPEFTAAICPAPCQTVCKRNSGQDGYPVQIREIEKQIVERAFREGWIKPQTAEEKSSKRVAIIGSGPAGLATAQQLARGGHDVTVYESDDKPGGLLRNGIPQFRLDKTLIDRRLEQLRAEGVNFKTAVRIGYDISAADVRNDFDALCLATGTPTQRDLHIEGRETDGIHLAMDYLRTNTDDSPTINAAGKTIVVIGGGETGNDCVEIALRQGAREVHQLEILPQNRTMMDPTHTPPEGVKQQWCVATKKFDSGDKKAIKALSLVKVNWVQTPKGTVMEEIPGSEFTLPVDMVILALGFTAQVDEDIVRQLDLKIDANGCLITREQSTNADGVFVAGDIESGPSIIATAIKSGRHAAEKINQYLRKT